MEINANSLLPKEKKKENFVKSTLFDKNVSFTKFLSIKDCCENKLPHTMEETGIYSHAFLAKISSKHRFY